MEDVLLASMDEGEKQQRTSAAPAIVQQQQQQQQGMDKLASMRRMVDSEMFTIHMAVHYLHSKHDQDITAMICRRMRRFPSDQVEFYLPQIICMCLLDEERYVPLRDFVLGTSARDLHFALLATWLLQAELENSKEHRRRHAIHALLQDINSSTSLEVLPHKETIGEEGESARTPPQTLSEALSQQRAFVQRLLTISDRLRRIASKDARRTQLYGELSRFNLDLPARTYLPLSIGGSNDLGTTNGAELDRSPANPTAAPRAAQPRDVSGCGDSSGRRGGSGAAGRSGEGGTADHDCEDVGQASWRSHHVVRIPPEEAVVLNSKDKAPYMLQVEVVDCADFYRSRLPGKQRYPRRQGHLRSQSDGASFMRTTDPLVRTRSVTSLKTVDGCCGAPARRASSSSSSNHSSEGDGHDHGPVDPLPRDDRELRENRGGGDVQYSERARNRDASHSSANNNDDDDEDDNNDDDDDDDAHDRDDRGGHGCGGQQEDNGQASDKDSGVVVKHSGSDMVLVTRASSTSAHGRRCNTTGSTAAAPGDDVDASDNAAPARPIQRSASLRPEHRLSDEQQTEIEDGVRRHSSETPDSLQQPFPPLLDSSPWQTHLSLSTSTSPLARSAPEEFVPVQAMNIRQRLHDAASTPESQFKRGHKDPSAIKAKEDWADKVRRIRRLSPFGHHSTWRLIPVIIKSGDDLRQELLATQLLALFQAVWQRERVSLWIRPIRILVTSASGGMIEVVGSAVSLHQTKKQAGDTLLNYFYQQFGPANSEGFLTAQQNFAESLAAYCLFTYLAQVKDRHNGNIMIDSEGHILHIDFGFFLSNSPGRNLGFETAPFKLLPGFVEVLGGVDSDMFRYFKLLLFRGFVAARKHKDEFVTALAIMAQQSQLPCFTKPSAVKDFEARFRMGCTDAELQRHVDKLTEKSLNSLRTRLYDNYQYLTNGIL